MGEESFEKVGAAGDAGVFIETPKTYSAAGGAFAWATASQSGRYRQGVGNEPGS